MKPQLGALIILLVGCAPEPQTSHYDPNLISDYPGVSTRFQLTDNGKEMRLFDTTTGDLWILLSGETNWTKLPNPFMADVKYRRTQR